VAAPRFLRRPAARPEELLDAALAVFGERGFRQTTLEEVATRAGVSKGTVYLYFASKDDLFRAVVERKVVMLREQVRGGTLVVHRMWEAMSRHDMVCLSRLVQAELTQFPEVRRFFFEQVIQRHRKLLKGIATRGVANGEFRPEATMILPRMVPPLVMQLNQNRFLFGEIDHGAPSATALRDAMLALFLEGIRKPAKRRAKPVAKKRKT